MKREEIQKLKTKPTAELEKELSDSEERLGSLKFDLASGKVKKTSEMRDLKKKIARIKTFLKLKQ